MNVAKPYTKRNEKRKDQPSKQIAYKHSSGKLQESVSQLQVNQEFANMTELFDAIDTYLPNSGVKRTTAINRLECFLSIEKLTGHKIKITEIYEIPIPWIDGRSKGNHRKKLTE